MPQPSALTTSDTSSTETQQPAKRGGLSRRDFLKTACNAAFLASLAGAAPNLFFNYTKAATGENPSEFVRVGFIGVGNQGENNLRALIENAVAVCDVDKSRLAKRRRRWSRRIAGRAPATGIIGSCSRTKPWTRW